ncbi:MAG: C10 family peptidase [Flavobacteriaceae bacterium]
MNKFKNYALLLTLVLIVFSFSCSNDDISDTQNQINNIEIKTVSLEQAKQVAVKFYNEQVKIENNRNYFRKALTPKSKKDISEIKLNLYEKSLNENFKILQFKNGGYVIIAANERQTPILAFSLDGEFKTGEDFKKNIALQDWIKHQTNEIELLKTHLETNEQEVKKGYTWDYYLNRAPPIDEEVIISGGTIYQELLPLMSTSWNQGCGYNDFAPNCNNGGQCGRAFTGCVATALAQVLRYHEYPNNYNWSDMPNSSGSSETSRLMRDIGNAVSMNYGCDVSGAYMSNAKNALKNSFGYSSAVALVSYNTEILWQQLELRSNPVILSGGDHAWVADGYKRYQHTLVHNPGTYYEYETYYYTHYYFNMNWGWGGAFDNWYLYNDFTPGNNNFNSNRKMIIWAQP